MAKSTALKKCKYVHPELAQFFKQIMTCAIIDDNRYVCILVEFDSLVTASVTCPNFEFLITLIISFCITVDSRYRPTGI